MDSWLATLLCFSVFLFLFVLVFEWASVLGLWEGFCFLLWWFCVGCVVVIGGFCVSSCFAFWLGVAGLSIASDRGFFLCCKSVTPVAGD